MVNKINLKKLLCLLMSALMIFSISNAAYAAVPKEDMISPLYVSIDSTTSSITISGVKATCKASLTAKSSMSLKITMELQKEKSSGYETVETWTKNGTGKVLSDNQSRTINIFSDYRLKTTFTAGSETVTLYSYPS